MQENLAITKGCVKARERSLRLVRRVAIAIDELDHHPTHEEGWKSLVPNRHRARRVVPQRLVQGRNPKAPRFRGLRAASIQRPALLRRLIVDDNT